jgi:HD-GYP domain-containing protein (c-di-GMP phosphodiesterase class II)
LARGAPKRQATPVLPYPPVAAAAPTIATADLQVGMFVHLDLGWMSHPFALSSFRIADAGQIETIRSLGLARVRWSPEQSDAPSTIAGARPAAGVPDVEPATLPRTLPPRPAVPSAAAAQRAAAALVERQHAEAARDWRGASDLARQDPRAAGVRLTTLSQALVDKMLHARELSIRAVAGSAGGGASHALNVGVISLLIGRLCGLPETDLQDLGVGALSHDLGKLDLPNHLHKPDEQWTAAEAARYREHVALGVALGQRMGLAPGALLVIGQHHEHGDGSGFPQGVDINRLSVPARIVALVNRYDNLCHPAQVSRALTPHEALSRLFSQGQKRYDPAVLNTFVRMMGVYPPGSVVQLTDDRFAVVESVNAARPLKPKVSVQTAGDEPALLDLGQEPTLGIRRSLPAAQLEPATKAHLLPRPRSAWFFQVEDEAPPEPAQDTKH